MFTTWRDGTRGVVESGRRVARQAYAALKWYEREYEVTPAVYFVGQSFGGLATRFLLSDPPREVYDTPLLNADGIFVCPEDRAKMDYLRDRTVLAHTLATPHEGSYMSEWGEPAKVILRDALQDLRTGCPSSTIVCTGPSPLANALRAIDASLTVMTVAPPNLVQRAQREIPGWLELLDTPALRDMKLDTMVAFNLGPLSPERARRSAGSPIAGAQGTLIPIYATLGRSPGGAVFDSPDVFEGWTKYGAETEKEKGWFFGTMFASDALTKQLIPNGFGRVDVAPYAEFASLLDRRARLFDLSTQTVAAEQFTATAAETLLDGLAIYFTGRYGPAVGGVLEYLADRKVQVFLPNAMVPITVDRVWKLGLTGSVEVPMIALRCGAQPPVVVDYKPLVRALLAGGRRTDAALAAVANMDARALLDAAFGAGEDAVELTLGTVRWLHGKLAAIDTMPKDCRLPLAPASVEDLLTLGNLVNWRVTEVMGTVPAPAWERTETPVRDGEMDNDGPVHSASALGFTLGRRPFFFEHDRQDGPVVSGRPTLGSWYRMPDDPVTEQCNNGLQYQNDVAQEAARRLLDPVVGPASAYRRQLLAVGDRTLIMDGRHHEISNVAIHDRARRDLGRNPPRSADRRSTTCS